jgi:uncharacterized membrane protein YfcA
MQLVLLFAFGIGVGILSGLLGIGGGVVLVPGLILLFGFSQVEAQGTSLAVLIPPIGIFAAIIYYQHGFVRLPVVGVIALGFMVGALLGAKLVPLLPLESLRTIFGHLLLYLGFTFVLNPRGNTSAAWPAMIAAGLAWLGACFLRIKRSNREPLKPPAADHDYHI